VTRENDDCVYVLAAWLLKYQRGRWWIARRQDRHAVKMRWHGPYRSLRLAALAIGNKLASEGLDRHGFRLRP
jgi:hypothetical protein